MLAAAAPVEGEGACDEGAGPAAMGPEADVDGRVGGVEEGDAGVEADPDGGIDVDRDVYVDVDEDVEADPGGEIDVDRDVDVDVEGGIDPGTGVEDGSVLGGEAAFEPEPSSGEAEPCPTVAPAGAV